MNVVNVVPNRSSLPPRSEPPAPHVPVMLEEMAHALSLSDDGVYVDLTLGAGGHSEALLEAGAGHVVSMDRDETAIALAGRRLARFGSRVTLVHAAFSRVRDELDALGIARVDGIIADLGVSSMQLDTPARGMSFRTTGPLDMRMDRSCGDTALELIERLDDDDLTALIRDLGEERRARRIARCIRQALEAGELHTTLDLRRAVVRAVGPARVGGIDPATRTFQALRIGVNEELLELERVLHAVPDCLREEGTFAVLTFHSLEDRITKRMLKNGPWRVLTKKPLRPSEDEVDDNPRARSAKLRIAVRRSD